MAERLAHACPVCNGCVNLDTMACDKCGQVLRDPEAAPIEDEDERESCPVCKGEGRRIDGEVCGSCFGTGEL